MEEEIIKTSGIRLQKAQDPLHKPDVVKIDPNMKVDKRERMIDGTEEDLSLEQDAPTFTPEDDAALAEQLQDDDPFANLESAEQEESKDNLPEEEQKTEWARTKLKSIYNTFIRA